MNNDEQKEHNADEPESPLFHPCFHPVEKGDNIRLFIWICAGVLLLCAVTVGFMLIAYR